MSACPAGCVALQILPACLGGGACSGAGGGPARCPKLEFRALEAAFCGCHYKQSSTARDRTLTSKLTFAPPFIATVRAPAALTLDCGWGLWLSSEPL